jgi:hypothetical protein
MEPPTLDAVGQAATGTFTWRTGTGFGTARGNRGSSCGTHPTTESGPRRSGNGEWTSEGVRLTRDSKGVARRRPVRRPRLRPPCLSGIRHSQGFRHSRHEVPAWSRRMSENRSCLLHRDDVTSPAAALRNSCHHPHALLGGDPTRSHIDPAPSLLRDEVPEGDSARIEVHSTHGCDVLKEDLAGNKAAPKDRKLDGEVLAQSSFGQEDEHQNSERQDDEQGQLNLTIHPRPAASSNT